MRIDVNPDRVDALAEEVQHRIEEEEVEPPAEVGEGLPEMLEAWAMRPDIVDPLVNLMHVLYYEGQIERELGEKLFVRISRLNECQFCTAQHTEALDRFDLDEAAHDKRQAAGLDFAEQVTENASRVSDELFARIQKEFTVEEIVELTFLIGFVNMLNAFNAALNIRYDPPKSVKRDYEQVDH